MRNYLDNLWETLVDYSIATEEELQLITSINGYSEETLNDVLYARTGYRDFEQFTEDLD
jgi:hypothetical protein